MLSEEGAWASLGDVQKLTTDVVGFDEDEEEDDDEFQGGQHEMVKTVFGEEDDAVADQPGGGRDPNEKGDEDDIENMVQAYFKQYYPEFETW